MGVLKVNVGDAVTPDWRKIGCGGATGGGAFTYDFADGTVPAAFVQSPTSPAATVVDALTGYSNTPGSFTKAMQLQDQGDSTTSTITLSVTIPAGGGTLTFYRAVQSESGADFARFHVDGVQQYAVSGGAFSTPAWTLVTVSLAAGSRTLAWSYEKDSSVSQGFDNQRIAGIVFTPTTPATGRLKLWTGTEWVREACDDDLGASLDTFDRSDSGSLGTASSGPAYSIVHAFGTTVDFDIASSQAKLIDGMGAAFIDTGHFDGQFSITLPSNSGGWNGIAFRRSGSTFYYITRGAFWYYDGSSSTMLAGIANPGSGDTQSVILSGSTFRYLLNGIEYLPTSGSLTMTHNLTSTEHGFYGEAFSGGRGTNGTYEDFTYGNPDAHPLKVNVGTPSVPDWQVVCCMVPV